MDGEGWATLSEWHNAWLDAPPGDRERLRRTFVAEHPALESEVRELVMAGPIVPGFLETSAFALTLHELAAEDAPLAPGTLVGPYQIVTLIARGGMGQVYRASDLRLSRDVAIKLLSGADRYDADLVERFLQEARITAALDRPNIVRVFDVGIHDDRPFLVMELLDGETLRDRIGRGRLPPDQIRRIALDVAHGLTTAHAAGLVHRDLKPENVFLTRLGPAKILDFGVAKLVQGSPIPGHHTATVAGMLVGTAGYLAPEQILGDPVDARADLFAFGAILYEMLTGRSAFGRAHTIDTLHAVLREPAPSLRMEPDVAPDMAAIAERLLEKDPAARFHSVADLAWTLDRTNAVAVDAHGAARVPRARRRWGLPMAAAATVLILAALWFRPWPSASSTALASGSPGVGQFTWRLPDPMRLVSAPVVSPDGRRIAFVGATGVRTELWIRDLATVDAKPVAGTAGAKQPFWSPDGRSLGFFANQKLCRVSLDGGAPVALADAPDARGGTWSPAGTIVFQPTLRDSSLMRISADGGPVAPATTLDVTSDDVAHRWPSFLPDGVHFLYQVTSVQDARRGVYVGSITEPAPAAGRLLLAGESGAAFVAQAGADVGTFLTARASRVEARPFDARALRFTGEATTIALPVADATGHHPALLSASSEVLALAATPVPLGGRLVVMSVTGERVQVLPGTALAGFPRLSPDGRRLVRSWVDTVRGNPDIWVQDLDRGTQLRLTAGRDMDLFPVWSPKGDRIAFRTGTGRTQLAIVNADGTGAPGMLACPRSPCEPTDWSTDGRVLLVNAGGDVWTVPVDAHEAPAPLLSGTFLERDARYSPDGRWVAYVSGESGRLDVSIRSVTGPLRRIVVSNQGGDQPVWRSDGSALFYVDHEQLLQRVSLHATRDGGLTPGRPERVRVPPFLPNHWGTSYDVSPDGTRILLPQASDEQAPNEVTIVIGWRALLKQP